MGGLGYSPRNYTDKILAIALSPPFSPLIKRGEPRKTTNTMNEIFESDYQKSRWKKEQEEGERKFRWLIVWIVVLFILYSIVTTN